MTVAAFQAFVHRSVPHEGVALYLTEFGTAIFAVLVVLVFSVGTRCFRKLESAWLIRVAAGAAPIPIYFILFLMPVDGDLKEVVLKEQIVVALAGVIALYVTILDFVKICIKAFKERPPRIKKEAAYVGPFNRRSDDPKG